MIKLSRKKSLGLIVSAALFIFSSVGTYSPVSYAAENDTHSEQQIQIKQQKSDIDVIPDKYNTGAKAPLTKVNYENKNEYINGEKDGTGCNIEIKASSEPQAYMVDFVTNQNKALSGEIIVENYDFSDYKLATVRESSIEKNLSIVFKNCKFDIIHTEYFDGNIHYEFQNCSIRRFWGSNASFDRCAFGGSWEDPLHPLRNVEVENSYFSDLNHATEAESHIDATQIMGYRYTDKETGEQVEVDAKDIKFKNCRFEVPNILLEYTKASVNACIMLQLEYSDIYGFSAENCILNGGSNAIYAEGSKYNRLLQNVSFSNIKIGAAQYNGAIYQVVDPNVAFKNVIGTNSLYIGSVYKQDGLTWFSVSNDTGRDRKLRIITDKNSYDFTFKAGPTRKTLENRTFKEFGDLPIDILTPIDEDCSYAVCYDITDPKEVKQIRFVNYTDENVFIDSDAISIEDESENSVVIEGNCGVRGADNLHYTLTEDGVLTISGNGKMDDYHSAYLPPWSEYFDFISKVVVVEGVTSIGNQAFNGCVALEKVQLPNGLEKIGTRSFGKCNTLMDINIPESVKDIDENAFSGFAKMIVEGKMEIEKDDESDLDSSDDSKENKEDDKKEDNKEDNKEDKKNNSSDNSQDSSDKNSKDNSIKDKDTNEKNTKDTDSKKTDSNNTTSNNIDSKDAEKNDSNSIQNKTDENKTESLFKVGKTIKDKKTGYVYKVKSVKKTPELALVKVPKKAIKVTVKGTVKLYGKKCKVTSIGVNAFKTNKKVKQITIEKNIKKISKGAFKGCKNLKKMIVKNKKLSKKYLKKIGLNQNVKVIYK